MKIEMRIIYNYIYNNIRILSIMISILYSQASLSIYRSYTSRAFPALAVSSSIHSIYTALNNF